MNRTIKDATVKRYHTATISSAGHLADFLDAYNYVRRLKTLSGITPYESHLQNLDIAKSAHQSQIVQSSIRSTRCRS